MMAIVGLTAGRKMLSSTFYCSDLTDKLSFATDQLHQISSTKNVFITTKTASFKCHGPSGLPPKALKECITGPTVPFAEPCISKTGPSEEESWEPETSIEALLLLQKSLLEKQLELSFEHIGTNYKPTGDRKKELRVTSSGIPARARRISSKKKTNGQNSMRQSEEKLLVTTVSPELIQNRLVGYVRGLTSSELLSHAQVVSLSQKIRTGISLQEHRSRSSLIRDAIFILGYLVLFMVLTQRLKEKLGVEPSDDQLAISLRIDRAELRSKLIECNLAIEKLAMRNVRLVMSIAQRYENMGAEMADLVQGGLMGLLRGIEKFDSSKGFKISTYVYWWIRQGVSRTLMENSRTLRLPAHLHERLSLIRGAKNRLEEKGINPSIDKISKTLNISHKKIKNATEAVGTVFSLDREPFPSLNGVPGKTYHSYIADNRLENNPWHGIDEWTLKNEVSDLIDTALRQRERDIIRLYYGLDNESLTWEEISKRIGLSRERVRQVGLVAVEKLKHAARKRRMEALLVKH